MKALGPFYLTITIFFSFFLFLCLEKRESLSIDFNCVVSIVSYNKGKGSSGTDFCTPNAHLYTIPWLTTQSKKRGSLVICVHRNIAPHLNISEDNKPVIGPCMIDYWLMESWLTMVCKISDLMFLLFLDVWAQGVWHIPSNWIRCLFYQDPSVQTSVRN